MPAQGLARIMLEDLVSLACFQSFDEIGHAPPVDHTVMDHLDVCIGRDMG